MNTNNTQTTYTKTPINTISDSSNDAQTPKPIKRKNKHLKLILSSIFLIVIIIGGLVVLYLNNQNQDLRKSADEGILSNRCQWCNNSLPPEVSNSRCISGLVCKTTNSNLKRIVGDSGICVYPNEDASICDNTNNNSTISPNCTTKFNVLKGTAVCDNKTALTDFTKNGGEIIPPIHVFNSGDTFVFRITVSSMDNTTGTVTVVDTLPDNLIFIDDDDNTDGLMVTNGDHTVVSINLSTMTKGETKEVEFRVQVADNLDILNGENATNSATITTNNEESSNSICSYEFNTIEGKAECISKEIYKDEELVPAGSALTRGEEYIYYITVQATNKTNGEVKVSDIIPTGLEFVRALPDSEQYITNEAGNNTILANLGILENEEVKLGFVVRVINQPTLGDLSNSALIYVYPTNSTEEEPFAEGSICAVKHTILPIGAAQCVEKQAFTDFDGNEMEANSIVEPGQEFIYRVSVQADDTTTGPVVLVDQLSSDLIFVEDSNNTEGLEYNSTTREITYDFGVINDDAIKTIEFKVQVIADPSGDKINNLATITTDDITDHTCEIPLKLKGEDYACNESCEDNAECQAVNESYICYTADIGNVCRLESNVSSTTCSTPATPTPTPEPGCNDLCSSNADCSNTAHICLTTNDGSNRCRLESYPDSESCTPPSTVASSTQPNLPTTLPQTGPEDWLNWLKAGLVTLGVGTALFLLL